MQKKYSFLEIIGEGAYGIVYKCLNTETNKYVAIKKFKETNDVIVQKTIQRELEMIRQLKHPNIVDFIEAFQHKGNLFIVFDYVDQNLLQLLEKTPNGLPPSDIKFLIYQLCKGIKYLHKNSNIIHRDIKPENLLVDLNNNLKLCDFGFARKFELNSDNNNVSIMTDYVATRWYRSPELLLSGGIYGPAVDYWAIGCIMGELIDGNPLFPGENDIDQINCIVKVLGNLPEFEIEMLKKNKIFNEKELLYIKEPETLEKRYEGKIDEDAIDFLKGLLNMDPDLRLNGETVFKHKYFEGYLDNDINKDRRTNDEMNSDIKHLLDNSYNYEFNNDYHFDNDYYINNNDNVNDNNDYDYDEENKENIYNNNNENFNIINAKNNKYNLSENNKNNDNNIKTIKLSNLNFKNSFNKSYINKNLKLNLKMQEQQLSKNSLLTNSNNNNIKINDFKNTHNLSLNKNIPSFNIEKISYSNTIYNDNNINSYRNHFPKISLSNNSKNIKNFTTISYSNNNNSDLNKNKLYNYKSFYFNKDNLGNVSPNLVTLSPKGEFKTFLKSKENNKYNYKINTDFNNNTLYDLKQINKSINTEIKKNKEKSNKLNIYLIGENGEKNKKNATNKKFNNNITFYNMGFFDNYKQNYFNNNNNDNKFSLKLPKLFLLYQRSKFKKKNKNFSFNKLLNYHYNYKY